MAKIEMWSLYTRDILQGNAPDGWKVLDTAIGVVCQSKVILRSRFDVELENRIVDHEAGWVPITDRSCSYKSEALVKMLQPPTPVLFGSTQTQTLMEVLVMGVQNVVLQFIGQSTVYVQHILHL